MKVKLWHDDVRTPPDGWVWARTNDEAKEILLNSEVIECSLDHDLGNHDVPPDTFDISPGSGMPQKGEETGFDLVAWMVAHPSIIPPVITIHAWNGSGAARMANTLRDIGHSPKLQSYRSKEAYA